ncbi:MAG: glycosyltransferase family 2 protein [Candidatus Synoicihabitans palmerolidicus]|nr:glycosyltransferase family 2 protein [Candidatus Synoicihabitans palmerolidicus]
MNKHFPALSVVVPFYNAGSYCEAALESISRQSFADFEAILVNGGSTDGSPEVAQSWTRRNARFRVIHHENNQNVACARNTGLEAALSPFVAQADADDINHLDRFHLQMEAAAKFPEVGIMGADLALDGGRVLRFPAQSPAIRIRALSGTAIPLPAAFFNRTVLGEARYNPALAYCEDLDFWLRHCFRVPTMNLPRALVHYRQPPQSLSNSLSPHRLEAERFVMQQRKETLGVPLDIEAGIATHLGHRTFQVGSSRIAAHILQLYQQSDRLKLAPPATLRREALYLTKRMWRYYGRQNLASAALKLLQTTGGLLINISRPHHLTRVTSLLIFLCRCLKTAWPFSSSRA